MKRKPYQRMPLFSLEMLPNINLFSKVQMEIFECDPAKKCGRPKEKRVHCDFLTSVVSASEKMLLFLLIVVELCEKLNLPLIRSLLKFKSEKICK